MTLAAIDMPMTDGGDALAAALQAWRDVLGADHVRVQRPGSASEGLRTFGAPVAVPATLFPADADQVSACLAIASRARIGVHPVSRGCNWGLGSRAPIRDGDVILDLSRMNAIDGFDAAAGIVHVEPGVTFLQLYEFLAQQDCDYFLPTIGGPVLASVLANALDRGDAVFCDRWSSLSDLSVVLADGTRVETGHGRGSALVGRGIPPAGPVVDGLFSQSNFGVVTGAWLRLEPLPPNMSIWTAAIGGREAIPALVARWKSLQRAGTLPDRSFILWNGIKYLARESDRASHDADRIARAELDEWICSGFVVGETPEILAARDSLVRTLFDGLALEVERFEGRTAGQWADDDAREVFATPRQVNLRTVYWRQDEVPPLEAMNPDRDGCGLLWLCLALPFEGAAILDFSIWCRERLNRAGMDFNLGLEAASFRTALAYVTLSYVRNTAADAEALAAYRDILQHALAQGFAPYRLANGAPLPSDPATTARHGLLSQLRRMLDEQDVITSGRVSIVD